MLCSDLTINPVCTSPDHVGNPCTLTFEDVNLETKVPWGCGNAKITSKGVVLPPLPNPCPVGPNEGPPPAPHPPTPPAPPTPGRQTCKLAKVVGCYNDTGTTEHNTMSPWFPDYVAKVGRWMGQTKAAAAA